MSLTLIAKDRNTSPYFEHLDRMDSLDNWLLTGGVIKNYIVLIKDDIGYHSAINIEDLPRKAAEKYVRSIWQKKGERHLKKIHFFNRKNTIVAGDCRSIHDIEALLSRGNLNGYDFFMVFKDFSIPINSSGSNSQIISDLKTQWNLWNEHRGKAYRGRLNASISGGGEQNKTSAV